MTFQLNAEYVVKSFYYLSSKWKKTMQNTDEDDGNDGSAQINLQVNFFNIKNAHKKAEEKKVSIPT